MDGTNGSKEPQQSNHIITSRQRDRSCCLQEFGMTMGHALSREKLPQIWQTFTIGNQ
jgi:hypothetical protein